MWAHRTRTSSTTRAKLTSECPRIGHHCAPRIGCHCGHFAHEPCPSAEQGPTTTPCTKSGATREAKHRAEIVNEDSQTEDVWDNEWPEEWLGTQVVVFEFTDRTIIAGGHIGHDSVLELTQAGAEQQGLELEIVDSSRGKYLVSIDGSAGEGWEYTVNGQPGVMSAEYSTVESDSVISWMQL